MMPRYPRLALIADPHVGPMGTKAAEDGTSAKMGDLARCLAGALRDATARGADLICIAGDLFDSWRPTPTAVDHVRRALYSAERRAEVVIIDGNHDKATVLGERTATSVTASQVIPGCHFVTEPGLRYVYRARPNNFSEMQDPESTKLVVRSEAVSDRDGLRLVIACLPWPQRHRLLELPDTRGKSPQEVNLVMRDKVTAIIRGLAAQAVEAIGGDPMGDIPMMLLAHLSVDAARAGGRTMMDSGDWNIPLADLQATPFRFIGLGHIHQMQEWNGGGARIAYAGSPEAVNFGEEGEEKGWLLVDFNDRPDKDCAPGEPYILFVPTEYRRHVTVNLETEPLASYQGQRFDGQVVRLTLPAHDIGMAREVVASFYSRGAYEVRLKVNPSEPSRRREIDTSLSDEDPVGAGIDAWLQHNPQHAGHREALQAEAHLIEAKVQEGARA